MGAALPVIGAVVGTVGTVQQISQQNSAASAQKDALKAQSDAAYQNTQLRLVELERQKLFSQFQNQIDNAGRSQERAFQVQDSYLQQKSLELDQTMLELSSGVQRTQADQGYENQRGQLQMAEGQNILQNQTDLYNIQGQAQDATIGADQQLIGADNQAAQALGQIYQQLRGANTQQGQAIKGLAAGKASLLSQTQDSTGRVSRSEQAQLDAGLANVANQFVSNTQDAGSAIDMLNIDANQAQAIRDYVANKAALTQGIQSSQSQQAFMANQRNIKSQQLNSAIQYGQSVLGMDLDQIMSSDAIKENLNALKLLEAAQTNRYDLENAQSQLNQRFYDTALSSQRLSTSVAGGAEQATLAAQRRGIQGGGALSALGALAQGGMSIYNAVSPPQSAQQILQQRSIQSNYAQLPSFGGGNLNSFPSSGYSMNSGAFSALQTAPSYSMGNAGTFSTFR